MSERVSDVGGPQRTYRFDGILRMVQLAGENHRCSCGKNCPAGIMQDARALRERLSHEQIEDSDTCVAKFRRIFAHNLKSQVAALKNSGIISSK